MKKVGIVTHYDVHNHGAILQLNALVQVLRERYAIEAKALQFDKNYDFLGHKLKAKYDISAKSIGIYVKYLTLIPQHYSLISVSYTHLTLPTILLV